MLSDFTLCDVHVRANTPCPELCVWNGKLGSPAVKIELTDRLCVDSPACAQRAPLGVLTSHGRDGSWYLDIPYLGAIVVPGPDEIRIAPNNVESIEELKPFLYGSALAILSIHRGWLPIRATVIAQAASAIAISGEAGVGKSGAALHLLSRGFTLVSDGVSVLSGFDEQLRAYALPTVPRFSVWRRVLETEGVDAAVLRRVRPCIEKFYIPALRGFAPYARHPIRYWVVLQRTDGPGEVHRVRSEDEWVPQLSRSIASDIRFLGRLSIDRRWAQIRHVARSTDAYIVTARGDREAADLIAGLPV